MKLVFVVSKAAVPQNLIVLIRKVDTTPECGQLFEVVYVSSFLL